MMIRDTRNWAIVIDLFSDLSSEKPNKNKYYLIQLVSIRSVISLGLGYI